ncbi:MULTISPECIES: ornithine cyclodeaminase family protein [unclassified Saccharicrinis]|uniref:ornithine cyclodeaminase family protein n=1 Tax=unclassified Saccharicrinis TaxID=2646859 RepID=UPI003D3323BF
MIKHSLIFNRTDIQSLMSLPEHIEVVENAFKLYAQGDVINPDLLHFDTQNGEFHLKAGGLETPKTYFGLKSNGGFFQNKATNGLPNIQGVILLHDGDNGFPLAIFESGDITIKRTGAATAVAAKYLAKKDADVATICGCGIQGQIQLESIMQVRNIKKVFAYDMNEEAMTNYAKNMSEKLNIEVLPATDLKTAILESQICICCTPSHKAFIKKEYIHDGLFIAAVGADSPEKQELDPQLLSDYKVVADILEQCVNVGECHHAIEQGLMSKDSVFAELGDVILGKKPGRESEEEVIIYDATGTALQDVAASAYIYEKAIKQDIGLKFQFPA